MREPTSKKTDAVEIRVSSEEKAKLKSKASHDGLTVSALIRQRLRDILHDGEPDLRENGESALMQRIISRAARVAVSRPAILGMVGAAALVALIAGAPTSSAESVQMDISAQIVRSVAPERSVSRVASVVDLDFGERIDLDVRDAAPGTGLYRISVIATPVDSEMALIGSSVARIEGESETVVATPSVMIRYGEPTEVNIGAPHGPEMSLRVVVSRS